MQQEALNGDDSPIKVWTHKDGNVARALARELGLGVDPALCLRAYFDGGCEVKQRLGAGGYLAYRPGGTLLAATANYYGHEGPTNNVSEARALVDCIMALDKVCWGIQQDWWSLVTVAWRNHSCIAPQGPASASLSLLCKMCVLSLHAGGVGKYVIGMWTAS